MKTVNLVELDLSNNDLRNLLKGIFVGLTRLSRLNLEENRKLHTIDAGAFKELIRLQTLYLLNHLITQLQNYQFEDLMSLRKLNLSRNQITMIS